MRRLVLTLSLTLALFAGGFTPSFVGVAEASHLACGAVVPNNTTTTLDANLGPCIGTALFVYNASGASGATVIDLNGFTILGVPGGAEVEGYYCGIEVNSSSGVTIKNGSVSDFHGGVCLGSTSQSTVGGATAADGVTVERSHGAYSAAAAGITLFDSSNNSITNNIVRMNTGLGGIVLGGNSDSNTVAENSVMDNAGPHYYGAYAGALQVFSNIRLEAHAGSGDPDANTISYNTVLNGLNGISISSQHASSGFDGAKNNTIEHNLVEGHAGSGILLEEGVSFEPMNPASSNTITHNTICANATAITLNSASNTVSLNQVGDGNPKDHPGGLPGVCLPNGRQ